MLPFFTNPYPDELLYSAIARYHFYSENLDCKDTLEELFDSRSVIPSVEIGSHLTNLVEKLGPQYSVEYLLANHTFYPYYASFLSKQRQMEILEDVKNNGGTILRINEVKSKEIPFEVISFSHPELSKYEKYNEPKKYTMHELKSSTEEKEKIIDETVEGTTEDFELIEMNKQAHKYAESPSIVKVQGKSTKQRTYEDESTKRYTFKDSGIRSASDTGGNRLARGIENQSLQQVQAEGEFGEFVHILEELEDYKEVQFINIQLSSLPIGDGKRVFIYLEDGITPRRYALAIVSLFNGKELKVLEVERENRALSILILSSTVSIN